MSGVYLNISCIVSETLIMHYLMFINHWTLVLFLKGHIEGWRALTGRRGRIRKQFLENFKGKRGY
jgi:hypothetical protein